MKRFFTIVFFISPIFIFAQKTNDFIFNLSGKVVDIESENPLKKVKLNIINFANKAKYTIETNDSGRFDIKLNELINFGDYSVIIEKEGYYVVNGFINIKNNGYRIFNLKKIDPIIPKDIVKPIESKIVNTEKDTLPEITNVTTIKSSIIDSNTIQQKESLEGFATNNLVFLIDISSSMNQDDKLPVLKEAIKYLIKLYRPSDKIAIITYSTTANILLPPTFANESEKINTVLNEIKAGGSSQAGNALEKAYTIAADNNISNGNNRIILATDGMFTNGDKEDKKILKSIQLGADKQILLSIFSFGLETYKAKIRLSAMAEAGKGNYAHIFSVESAKDQLLKEAKSVVTKE